MEQPIVPPLASFPVPSGSALAFSRSSCAMFGAVSSSSMLISSIYSGTLVAFTSFFALDLSTVVESAVLLPGLSLLGLNSVSFTELTDTLEESDILLRLLVTLDGLP